MTKINITFDIILYEKAYLGSCLSDYYADPVRWCPDRTLQSFLKAVEVGLDLQSRIHWLLLQEFAIWVLNTMAKYLAESPAKFLEALSNIQH